MEFKIPDRASLLELLRSFYGISVLGLIAYGIQTEKPAPIATAMTLAIGTGTRATLQKLVVDPKRSKIETLKNSVAGLEAENYLLKDGLEKAFKTGKQMLADRERLEKRIIELERWFEESKDELSEAVQKLRDAEEANQEWQIAEAQWKATLQTYKEPLTLENKRLQETLKRVQADYRTATDELNASIERNAELAAEINYLRLQLQALLSPKKLSDDLDTNRMANSLVDWLQQIKPSIHADAESASVNGQDWVLMFRLKNSRDGLRLIEYAPEMANDFSFPELPTIKVSGDRVKITVHRGEVHNESKYLKVDPVWLKQALVLTKGGKLETHHARFQGSTETGKSTLVCNAIGCVIRHIPKIDVVLADPLLKGKSEWGELNPTFKGEEASIAGLIEFFDEYKRIDEGKQEIGSPRIFVLDEFDKLIGKHPELIALILELWKSGRHYERYFWAISQSALVGKWGLNMEDVDNLIGFYLGKTIERGFSDSNEDPSYISRLREEWHITKARNIPYVCFVRPHTVSKRPFLAKMPEPGFYAAGNSAMAIVEQTGEESKLDYYAAEFDIGQETINQLNNLYQQDSEPVKPNESKADPTTAQVIDLHLKGRKAYQIVKEIWGLSPSKSTTYKEKRQLVDEIIERYENRKDS